MTQSNKCLRDSDFWLPPWCSQTSINPREFPYIFWIITDTKVARSSKKLELFFHTLWRTILNLGPSWHGDGCAVIFWFFFNRLSRIIFALKKQRSKNDSVMFVVVFISLYVVGIYKIGCCAIYNIISVT